MPKPGAGPTTDFETAKSDLTEKLQDAKGATVEALHNARDQIGDKAAEIAAEARDALLGRVEQGQRDISSNLAAFGGALRAASEHLGNADQRTVSKFVLDAAGGLERLSSTLKNKSVDEVLQEIRSFGRSNSSALIAGSVLAGLALGRFIRASDRQSTGQPLHRDGKHEPGGDDGWSSEREEPKAEASGQQDLMGANP